MPKLKNNEPRPKCTGSYKKKACNPGGGVLTYSGYTGVCRWRGYGIQAILSGKGYGFQAIWSGMESSNQRKLSSTEGPV